MIGRKRNAKVSVLLTLILFFLFATVKCYTLWSIHLIEHPDFFSNENYVALPTNCTMVHASTSGCINYVINTGDTLCVNENYNCVITFNGGAIYISPGVVFNPSFSGDLRGSIINDGTINFNGISLGNNAKLFNHSEMTFLSTINFNGAAEFVNQENGQMSFTNTLSLNQSTSIVNNGDMDVIGNFLVSASTSFTNNYEFTLTGDFTTDLGGQTINNGRVISSAGSININAASIVTNNCTFSATNNISINEDLQNNGLLFIHPGTGMLTINNASTLINNGNVVSPNILVNGIVEGNGFFWITEISTHNNAGSFGNDGNGLNIYDSSTPPSGQFFDTQNGFVHSSVTNNPPNASNPIPLESDLSSNCSPIILSQPEICNDGIDNDFDGFIDSADSDCCGAQAPVLSKQN